MATDPHALLEKIRALPAERRTEIEDLVDFILAREKERALTRAASAASELHLQKSGVIQKTTHTMPFEFGDVVLVPFPFTSQAGSKKRPAVIVSNRHYNEAKPDIVLMAVTSQGKPSTSLGECSVRDWNAAGLLKPSSLKPMFATVEQSLVIRKLGSLAPGDCQAVKQAITEILG